MTSDRELLEKAARAAGVTHPDILRAHMASGWNPLTDDGDALRLAVKLGLDIQFQKPSGVEARNAAATSYYVSNLDSDPYAATRRAIVRAAAAIWKETP